MYNRFYIFNAMNLFNTIKSIIYSFIIINIIIFTPLQFFTSVLTDGLLLEFK